MTTEHVALITPWPDDPDAAASALEHEKRNAKRTMLDGYNLRPLPFDVSDVEVVSLEQFPAPGGEWGARITFRLANSTG